MINAAPDDQTVPPWVRRFVGLVARRSNPIVLGGFLLFLLSGLVATRLQLHSDFTELLPQDDLELKELKQIADKVGGASNLIVAVEGPNPQDNERFAEALVKNLRSLIGTDLRAIDYRADESRSFFERNRILYADLSDLRRAQDDLKKLIVSSKNPAFLPFADSGLGEEDDDPAQDLRRLREKLRARTAASGKRLASGYFESEDRTLLAIVTWANSSGMGDQSGFVIRDHVESVIAQTHPQGFGAVTAHVTGDVPSAIEEHDALKSDIERVSLVCMSLVLVVIMLYYRSVISLTNIFFPTLLGVAMAFGVTALTIGYLNTNTAFLGSIILGNGINFGIILLARYREERDSRPEGDTESALGVAIFRTAQPTLTAALTAGIAYASLAFTHFRGFRQFGEVGGIGIVLCWILTYSYGSALIVFWDRLRPRHHTRRPPARRLVALATAVLETRRALVVVILLVSAAAVWLMVPLVRDPFEYDFSKLRNQESRKHGVGELYVRVGRIFPQDLAPVGVALLPHASDAPAFQTALLVKDCVDGLTRAGDARARDPLQLGVECARRVAKGEATGGLLSAVATVFDDLPREQTEKLAVIADIRHLLADSSMTLLSADDRHLLDEWVPATDLRALTVSDLPDAMARRFRELDGTVGRLVLIYPIRVWPNWDGHSLMRLSEVIKNVRLPGGAVIDAAGQPSLFAAMLRSIGHDGPIATYVACVGVALMVVLLFRKLRPVGLVLFSLTLGILWMAGAGAVLGLKLNFLNFVVLPITLGIGVDYAVNVFARLEGEPPENRARALAETGSAVALCSVTTIIGYSSLLISSNGALRSFGKLADVGEVTCLLAALLMVPSAVRRRDRRPGSKQPEGHEPVAAGSGTPPRPE